MNNLTKAAIAGAAGIALLLGGAGSLAFWNDSTGMGGASITAGTLTISSNTDGAWTNDGNPVDLATFRAVPGDELVFTATFNVTATGDNLSATVGITGDSIVAASAGGADTALAGLLTESASFLVDGVSTTTVVGAAGTQVVTVSVTVTWPDGTSAADNAAKNGAVDLTAMTITLTQDV